MFWQKPNEKNRNFFVDLKNPVLENSNNNNIGEELRELEAKAKRVKEENKKNPQKVSIFSKIFGSNGSKNEIYDVDSKIQQVSANKEIKEISPENQSQKEIKFEENQSLNIEEKKSEQSEDDLLQIPAFLRRQVN